MTLLSRSMSAEVGSRRPLSSHGSGLPPMAELRDLSSGAGGPRFAEVFRDAFALFVGQGRRFSCEAVAAATKIPLRTVRAYQCGECLPSWERLWLLMLVLPTEFTDM